VLVELVVQVKLLVLVVIVLYSVLLVHWAVAVVVVILLELLVNLAVLAEAVVFYRVELLVRLELQDKVLLVVMEIQYQVAEEEVVEILLLELPLLLVMVAQVELD
jgi:hypothetical protein